MLTVKCGGTPHGNTGFPPNPTCAGACDPVKAPFYFSPKCLVFHQSCFLPRADYGLKKENIVKGQVYLWAISPRPLVPFLHLCQ